MTFRRRAFLLKYHLLMMRSFFWSLECGVWTLGDLNMMLSHRRQLEGIRRGRPVD